MKVRVRLFASLREAVAEAELELDLPEGATAEDGLARARRAGTRRLAGRRASLSAAVNRRYAAFDAPLADGDESSSSPR